jgi:hypothetical protein
MLFNLHSWNSGANDNNNNNNVRYCY